jgi:putative membrane protein
MAQISDELKKQIAAKVKEAEKLSALEFVPVFVPQSARYRLFRFVLSSYLSLSLMTYFLLEGWARSIYFTVGISWGAGIGLFFILSWRPLLSRILPGSFKHEEVEEAARVSFLEHEVFATKNRTGILIFVSELERLVYLLADKSVAAKISAQELSGLAGLLAKDLARSGSGEVFVKAITELSQRLSKDFPPEAGDKNELSDELRS